jgi:hypothetical protein
LALKWRDALRFRRDALRLRRDALRLRRDALHFPALDADIERAIGSFA